MNKHDVDAVFDKVDDLMDEAYGLAERALCKGWLAMEDFVAAARDKATSLVEDEAVEDEEPNYEQMLRDIIKYREATGQSLIIPRVILKDINNITEAEELFVETQWNHIQKRGRG